MKQLETGMPSLVNLIIRQTSESNMSKKKYNPKKVAWFLEDLAEELTQKGQKAGRDDNYKQYKEELIRAWALDRAADVLRSLKSDD